MQAGEPCLSQNLCLSDMGCLAPGPCTVQPEHDRKFACAEVLLCSAVLQMPLYEEADGHCACLVLSCGSAVLQVCLDPEVRAFPQGIERHVTLLQSCLSLHHMVSCLCG